MMRLRRASVIVTLSLLAWTATASAECAWMLWFNPEANVHVVESAHHSMGECDAALVDMRTVLGRDGYTVYGATAFSDHVLLGEKGMERVTYRCLPDTIDPRGPKSK